MQKKPLFTGINIIQDLRNSLTYQQQLFSFNREQGSSKEILQKIKSRIREIQNTLLMLTQQET